jgi:hypothetical protein
MTRHSIVAQQSNVHTRPGLLLCLMGTHESASIEQLQRLAGSFTRRAQLATWAEGAQLAAERPGS